MNLNEIGNTVLDGRTKGIPHTVPPFALREIAAQRFNLLREDMPLPLMVLRRSALDHNAAAFGDYLTAHDLSLAPHGKTSMAPQLFAEQLAHGAWGITAATVQQMLVMHHFGVRRVVMANQLLGRAAVRAVVATINADPGFSYFCYVDSVAQLANMVRHLADAPPARPINLLIEVGVMGGRTGLRHATEAQALAQAILAADPAHVRFAGIAAFEGVVPGGETAAVDAFAASVVAIAAALPAALYNGLDEFLLTGGGSTHFDVIASRFKGLSLPLPVRVLLRSGCYVTHDHGSYKAAQDTARADPERPWKGTLRPALELWSYVQSCPEPGLALLTMGKRDAPYDAGLPTPFLRYRPGTGWLDCGSATVFALNDQHAYVRLGDGADWQVGDMIGCGISHPCTAFDKWRFLAVVDDDYAVIDGVLTCF